MNHQGLTFSQIKIYISHLPFHAKSICEKIKHAPPPSPPPSILLSHEKNPRMVITSMDVLFNNTLMVSTYHEPTYTIICSFVVLYATFTRLI